MIDVPVVEGMDDEQSCMTVKVVRNVAIAVAVMAKFVAIIKIAMVQDELCVKLAMDPVD
jgi:hypothetical protein